MSYIENEIIPAYRFDKHGHFFQVSGAQIVKKKDGTLGPAVPSDCVLFAPEDKEGYWYVINEEKTEWVAVKKPTTAEECLGIVIAHEDQCEYAHEVRKLFEDLTKDSTEYRIHRDEETLAQSVEKIPEKTFDEVKAEKERELSSKASAFEQTVCKSMVIKSSIGYLMDADKRSQENIQGVLTIMRDAKTTTCSYRCGDNVLRDLTAEQLETVYKEALINGQNLYTQKWQFETQLEACETKEELEALSFDFKMTDFSSGTPVLEA